MRVCSMVASVLFTVSFGGGETQSAEFVSGEGTTPHEWSDIPVDEDHKEDLNEDAVWG